MMIMKTIIFIFVLAFYSIFFAHFSWLWVIKYISSTPYKASTLNIVNNIVLMHTFMTFKSKPFKLAL